MRKRLHLTFWQVAEMIPPILARLLARKRWGRALHDSEIAATAGMTADEVFMLSHMTTWKGVDIVTMRNFLTGCGVDFCNREQIKRARIYLDAYVNHGKAQRPTWKYLRTSPEWKARYEPLLRRWHQSLSPITKPKHQSNHE